MLLIFAGNLKVAEIVVTLRKLKILTGHIEKICSSESKLSFYFICPVRILNILEFIGKILRSMVFVKFIISSDFFSITFTKSRIPTGHI